MADIPKQETYAGLTEGAYRLGKSLSKRKASRVFNTSKYKNILAGAQAPSGAPVPVPPTGPPAEQFKKLGAVTTPYGGATRFEKFHPGVDVANKIGTNIPLYTGGKVTDLVKGKGRGKGFGNYVIITDPSGAQHRYSHLHQTFLEMGQEVESGDILGTVGTSGATYSTSGGSGAHLDYRIRDAYGKYVNPSEYLANF